MSKHCKMLVMSTLTEFSPRCFPGQILLPKPKAHVDGSSTVCGSSRNRSGLNSVAEYFTASSRTIAQTFGMTTVPWGMKYPL